MIEKDGKNKNEEGNNEEEKAVNEFDPNKGSLYLQNEPNMQDPETIQEDDIQIKDK